jgi:hypothetical protein
MESIFDLFERELTSDILALTNIGKRISGNKDIMILFTGNTPAVYTDCRFIYLPNKFKTDLKSAQGLVAHEGGHIGYGSFELCFIKLVDTLSKKHKVPPIFAKNLINVMEDVRVNAINKRKFPGFYRNLRMLTSKMLPQLKSRINSDNDILTYINLYFDDFDDFQKKPKLTQFNLSKDDWKGVTKVKKFLLKSLSPSASIISCDVLCNILKKYLPEQPKSPPPNRGGLSGQPQNTINQMEFNSRNKKNNEKTELDKTSEELIDKIKNQELNPDDLDDLIDEENEDENRKGKKVNNKKNKKRKSGKNKKPGKEEDNFDEEGGGRDSHEDLDENLDKKHKSLKASQKKKISEKEIRIKDLDSMDLEFNKGESEESKDVREKLNQNQVKKNKLRDDKKEEIIRQIGKLIEKANDAMEERLLTLERQIYQPTPRSSKGQRKVDDVRIESQSMVPDSMTYAQIKSKYMNIIKKLKTIFEDLRNKTDNDTFQKMGRLNSKLIKAVTSDYQFKKCFTRKIINKELRLIIIVDISGSMRGVKIRAAKIALIMLYEALEGIANIKIVLFTGTYHAVNILVKDFNETLNPRKFDKFGCHANYCQNIDGVSIKHEADKLEKDDIVIVISDGQPSANGGYSLYDAIPDIHDVRKRFRVFAFSIDSQGEYLNKMYGKDWILTSSRNELELGQKMVRFSQILVNEFYR